jgi:hypothetical protein
MASRVRNVSDAAEASVANDTTLDGAVSALVAGCSTRPNVSIGLLLRGAIVGRGTRPDARGGGV